uniref:hypothetical protein n=2 Tax=Amaricoccus TaxID=56999 RepID=UPI00261787ED
MIRAAVLGLLAAGAAAPLAAAEGGAIRGGEHEGFTRIVLTVEPTTEWSLETADGRATLRFPGRALAFDTAGVYDRIPRTRVTAVTVVPDPGGTMVAVDLGCDCRVSTSFVGAQYLALDIADRDAALPEIAEPAETATERAVREARAVASAEEVLIRQIERAASQGIVRFTEPEAPAAAESATAGPAAGEPPIPPDGLQAVAAALAENDQIEATTVFDRDSRNALASTADMPPGVCLEDVELDVGAWSNGFALTAQLPALERQLVSEFDAPNPDAVRDLARLYIRFGFGAEAEMLLAAFPDAPLDRRTLLADLARAVEGRPLSPGGPLSVAVPCPGNHALWLALGGAAPAYRDAAAFAAGQAAFGLLPADLRLLLAPRWIDRLLAEDRPAEARLILDTAARPGEPVGADLEISAARITAAEGNSEEAVRTLDALREADGHASLEALTGMARVALDARLALPSRVVTDLSAAALQYRGAPPEAELRGLLVAALARSGELSAALAETRAAMHDLPAAAPGFATLMAGLLAEAEPAAVGAATYAETALAAEDLLAAAPPTDPARIAVASRLVALGLPDPALALVAAAVAADDPAARLVAAEAELGRRSPDAAREALGPLASPEATALRARAFALDGAYDQALSALERSGMAGSGAPYAWPSGDWPRARTVAEAPAQRTMAAYMEVAAGAAPAPAPAADPAALPPDLAFREPLPPLDRPSLDAARR